MKNIKMALYFVGLGMSLVAYAHFTFATKSDVSYLVDTVKTIDGRVYDMHRFHNLKDKKK